MYESSRNTRMVNDVAGTIIAVLLNTDRREVRGEIRDNKWRPASVILAHHVYPGTTIATNSRDDVPGYTRYAYVMAALTLLSDMNVVCVHRDTMTNEYWRITLCDDM